MKGWALDLGTTNSGVARWNEGRGQPELVELPDVCRNPEFDDPLDAPRMVPSAVHLLEKPGLVARLGSWRPLERRAFLGRRALIGRLALERNRELVHPAFVPTFKAALSSEATRPLARVGRRPVTARELARAFLRELLVAVKHATGERVRDLVVTSPVSAFETYRAEVQRLLMGIGVRHVRFLDEPVAAALGYGLSLSRERTVLVVDIGGGTMHVVLVALSPQGALGGEARVLAKQGRPLGGNAVDGWVLEEACRLAGYPPLEAEGDEQSRFWRRLMLAEACRVKEGVHFDETAVFRVTPPGFNHTSRPGSSLQTFTRAQLASLLERNGFYRGLESCLLAMFEDGKARVDDVDDVLLVGGSTLLPGVFARLEQRFQRRRLRAWQPFEAVAYGGACYAAGRVGALDFIVHDYAFLTHDARTGEPQHTVVVPRGTRFPTPPAFWKRQLVPTCSLGEPESIFRLVICEVARADGSERRFVFDAAGDLHQIGGSSGQDQVVVPLNAASPTLGYLDPPHDPRDRRPRLEIAFGVNAERWLVATVHDLLTRRELMREEPVVRLV
ncbi:MAG TPA: Hsp70 family protein [Vicinamibacteria bacterium]|nr:Hsp70 family protein [Vicinamibacteria bacterium]